MKLVQDGAGVGKERWRYKKIDDHDGHRIEVRKTAVGNVKQSYAPGRYTIVGTGQLLLTVRPDGTVMFSSNAKVQLKIDELCRVIHAAQELL